MASIESLSPDEQELIVTALKWVVWSITGITVIEIADHYKEIYYESTPDGDGQTDGKSDPGGTNTLYSAEIQDIIRSNPYKDPEVKDVIYHLENAGRDFFKIDRETGLVSVDISIREWIQDAPTSNSITEESRGFRRYRDHDGATVFKFRLTRKSSLLKGPTSVDLNNIWKKAFMGRLQIKDWAN
ncbi:hypothetical protein ABW20_dc0102662 [Dactylellina cionopaga]|nr:hypothetical protein ABW20_dc0102662 [Dactylellina cionopaga]